MSLQFNDCSESKYPSRALELSGLDKTGRAVRLLLIPEPFPTRGACVKSDLIGFIATLSATPIIDSVRIYVPFPKLEEFYDSLAVLLQGANYKATFVADERSLRLQLDCKGRHVHVRGKMHYAAATDPQTMILAAIDAGKPFPRVREFSFTSEMDQLEEAREGLARLIAKYKDVHHRLLD